MADRTALEPDSVAIHLCVHVARWLLLAVVVAAGSGCQSGYVLRQCWFYLDHLGRAVPLDDESVRASLDAEQQEKLAWVPEILQFCRDELGLETGDSYTTFLDTGGRPVSYAVTAAHPLALVPYRWHFPLAGRVPYKGYFKKRDAQAEAKRLTSAGYDAAVFPVGAFSTLGWFRDPLLSTMLEEDLPDIAELIIHETTHRTVYFPGNSSINESLATHVAREGTARFLKSHPELRHWVPSYLAQNAAARDRETLLLRLRNDLRRLYASSLSTAEKLRQKEEILRTAGRALDILRPDRDGNSRNLSNAYVLGVVRYHEYEDPLKALQTRLGGEPRALIEHLKKLRAEGVSGTTLAAEVTAD